jgi:predicted component of type VI protein secretion system
MQICNMTPKAYIGSRVQGYVTVGSAPIANAENAGNAAGCKVKTYYLLNRTTFMDAKLGAVNVRYYGKLHDGDWKA